MGWIVMETGQANQALRFIEEKSLEILDFSVIKSRFDRNFIPLHNGKRFIHFAKHGWPHPIAALAAGEQIASTQKLFAVNEKHHHYTTIIERTTDGNLCIGETTTVNRRLNPPPFIVPAGAEELLQQVLYQQGARMLPLHGDHQCQPLTETLLRPRTA